MAKLRYRKKLPAETIESMERRVYEEDSEPLTDEDVRRQLGFGLLPFNGGDREDFDN